MSAVVIMMTVSEPLPLPGKGAGQVLIPQYLSMRARIHDNDSDSH